MSVHLEVYVEVVIAQPSTPSPFPFVPHSSTPDMRHPKPLPGHRQALPASTPTKIINHNFTTSNPLTPLTPPPHTHTQQVWGCCMLTPLWLQPWGWEPTWPHVWQQLRPAHQVTRPPRVRPA